jgi:uncharacterized membrane protein YvlD (DUF360 family)
VASRLVDSTDYSSFGRLAIAAAVLGVVNLVVKPLLTVAGCLLGRPGRSPADAYP